ncbi:hypothetical protein [Microbacterium tumbae]
MGDAVTVMLLMMLLLVLPLPFGSFGVAFAFSTRPGAENAKLRTESIFDFESMSSLLRNRRGECSDTLEQIFSAASFLGYGFDNDTPPRATDIGAAAADQPTKEQP